MGLTLCTNYSLSGEEQMKPRAFGGTMGTKVCAREAWVQHERGDRFPHCNGEPAVPSELRRAEESRTTPSAQALYSASFSLIFTLLPPHKGGGII